MAPGKIQICKSVLIIEDDDDIRETLQQLLELEGYSVRSAANGRQGLDLLPQMGTPCLILLDLMMPVMDGWEFLKVKSGNVRIAPIPVVVVSALDNAGQIKDVRGYIKKPIEYNSLMRVVSEYCGIAPS